MTGDELAAARRRMVDEQLRARGIIDGRVLGAMGHVPRERFVEERLRDLAYEDRPLTIPGGQTISQPYMVARMLEVLELSGDERVLEIGAGSGYQTALLAELAADVRAVERLPELAALADRRVRDLGYANVEIACFDGTNGWPEHAPYDAIVVAAGAPRIPAILAAQLADQGRLVIPVGDAEGQRLAIVTRRGDHYDTVWDTPCTFVPLVGRYGWHGPGPGQA